MVANEIGSAQVDVFVNVNVTFDDRRSSSRWIVIIFGNSCHCVRFSLAIAVGHGCKAIVPAAGRRSAVS